MERRYIDANALQARLERKKAGIANQRYTEGWNDCMMRVKSMVSKAPLADVTPVVHGHWIKDNDSFQTDTNCQIIVLIAEQEWMEKRRTNDDDYT